MEKNQQQTHTFVTPVVKEKPPVPQSQRELVTLSLLVRPARA
jgi:hypothetical protein